MSLAALVVLGLAAARVWRLLAVDDILRVPRDRLTGTTRRRVDGQLVEKHDRPTLNTWLSCPWCAGAWLSLLVVAVYRLAPTSVVFWIVAPLAVSEVVGLIVRNLDPPED